MLRGLKHLLCMIQSDIHVFLNANELIYPGYLFFNAFGIFMQRFCVHIYFHLEMRNLRRSSTVKFGYLSGKIWENVNIFLYTHRREKFFYQCIALISQIPSNTLVVVTCQSMLSGLAGGLKWHCQWREFTSVVKSQVPKLDS